MRLIGSGRRTRDLFSSFAHSFARAGRSKKVLCVEVDDELCVGAFILGGAHAYKAARSAQVSEATNDANSSRGCPR